MADVLPGTPAPVPDGPYAIRTLLEQYGLRARKELGQHFLSDPALLDKIVQAAELTGHATVLEIGPGPGMLTRHLAQVAGRVVAVELDDGMVRLLRAELGALRNVEIVQGDILKLSPLTLLGSPIAAAQGAALAPYAVVANLPYYITTAVIRHLLESEPPPSRLVLTMQLEVAQRIVAGPGRMSLLAVSVQFYGQPRIVARIPAGAFVPPPQVDSAVLRVDTYPRPPVDVPGRADFFRVVRAGFGQKRKQLKNALTGGLGLPSPTVAATLAQAGIAPQRRAETLSLAEWAALAWAFVSVGHAQPDLKSGASGSSVSRT
jgi:16S rRNA (adenine1518-N6/adenine1519-N6)-dimethyltransferase